MVAKTKKTIDDLAATARAERAKNSTGKRTPNPLMPPGENAIDPKSLADWASKARAERLAAMTNEEREAALEEEERDGEKIARARAVAVAASAEAGRTVVQRRRGPHPMAAFVDHYRTRKESR